MRHINLIVIHCSATPNGRAVSVDDLRAWHRARGFQDVGYHYVVLATGATAPGRPVGQPGAHVAGLNAHSVGVCMVGGTGGPDKWNPGQYTLAQWDALKSLVQDLQLQYPGSSVVGHRDLSPDLDGDGVVEQNEWIKLCPSFDVAAWLASGMTPHINNILEENLHA